jgi:hypothetical protein
VKRDLEVWLGEPYPLGATLTEEGVNFALYSEDGTAVELTILASVILVAVFVLMAVVPNVWIFLPIAALAGLSWTVSRMTKSETEVIHRALEMHAGSETPVVRHYLRANRRSTPLGFGQFRKRIEDWFSNADASNSREQKKPGWSMKTVASSEHREEG